MKPPRARPISFYEWGDRRRVRLRPHTVDAQFRGERDHAAKLIAKIFGGQEFGGQDFYVAPSSARGVSRAGRPARRSLIKRARRNYLAEANTTTKLARTFARAAHDDPT
jgi:hypothetical protein